jgi:hypothetical protein
MANKRMFSLSVVDTDRFLEMSVSARLLYYELGMRADDDGFVDNWKKILLFTGLKEDDLKLLITKSFIIPFESGVLVIKHWRMNNYLQKDRTKPTIYQDELKQLGLDENNVYIMDTSCIHSIDKNSIDKNSIEYNNKQKHKYGEYKHVLLTDNELERLKNDFTNYEELINYLDEYIEMKGYKAKNHNLAIRKWVVDAVKEYKNKHKVIEDKPEWFNKNIEEQKATEEEKKEMEEILKNFK